MDLFIATVPYETVCPQIAPLRLAMRDLCLKTWRHMGFRPILHMYGSDIYPPSEQLASVREWQRYRRMLAEEEATGKFYLSTSDDVLPDVTSFDRQLAAVLMENYSRFAILAANPLNERINPWTPKNYEPVNDEHVMEHCSVGTISVCRKGAMLDWPKMGEGPGYDAIQGEYLRSHGWRVGIAKQLGCVHLGKGLSSLA